MQVTEVRIKLMEDTRERLQGFCSITLDDCFVVRDLKIIEGASGPFVAMPSRKLTAHCPKCNSKNHLRAAYCNQCGGRLGDARTIKEEDGRVKLYADIAHPINSSCREMIQERVIQAYRDELGRSKLPGYVSTYDDFEEEAAVALAPDRAGGRSPAEPTEPAAETSTAEKTRREAAEPQPRGPHKPPAHRGTARGAPGPGGPKPGTFGAGIF